MKAFIVIECDDEPELLLHLQIIRKQLHRAIKKRPEGVIDTKEVLEDNNCYGFHKMVITPDKPHGKEKKKR